MRDGALFLDVDVSFVALLATTIALSTIIAFFLPRQRCLVLL